MKEIKNLLLVFLCLLSTLVLVGCDVIKDIVGGYDEKDKPDPYLLEYKFKLNYNYKINGQAIKKYTVCQNESNDLGAMTTFCQLRTTQVRRNIELHSTDTFFEIY